MVLVLESIESGDFGDANVIQANFQAIKTFCDNLEANLSGIPILRADGSVDLTALQKYKAAIISGATNATPIVITSVGNGRVTGDIVLISDVLGNTAANGIFTITRITDDTFSLDGSVGNGAYTSGGNIYIMPKSNEDLVPKKYVDALIPAGHIDEFLTLTAPVGYLKNNGASVSRTTYANLFKALVTDFGFTSQTFTVTIASPAVFTKTEHGFNGGERLRLSTTGTLPTGLNTTTDYFVKKIDANTFNLCSDIFATTVINTSGTQTGTHSYLRSICGLGDGSTTFNLPDIRGEFKRGLDDGRGVDALRGLGTSQLDDLKAHTHALTLYGSVGGYAPSSSAVYSNPINTSTVSTGGTETRPRNIALLSCIKY